LVQDYFDEFTISLKIIKFRYFHNFYKIVHDEVTISRKAHFNAAHRLYRKDWTFEKNDLIFGKCNNPNYHGHNYDLIVNVTGDIDPETGFVMDVNFS
jgi:hypothetical protein